MNNEHPLIHQQIVDNWTDVEVLHQKFSAEKKYKDSIKCITDKYPFHLQQKDSIIQYWSNHPEELMELTGVLIEKNK